MTTGEILQGQLLDPFRWGLLVALVLTMLRTEAQTGRWLPLAAALLAGCDGSPPVPVGRLPAGARADLSVDGTVEVERLTDVLSVGRPAYGQPESTVGLFRLSADGATAERVQVALGRASVTSVEVRGGLRPGDRVIVSDVSLYDAHSKLRIK